MAIFNLKIAEINLGKASKNAPKLPRKKLQKTQKSAKSLFFTDASEGEGEGEVKSTRSKKIFDLQEILCIFYTFCSFLYANQR